MQGQNTTVHSLNTGQRLAEFLWGHKTMKTTLQTLLEDDKHKLVSSSLY